jgi:hypothetical protein
VGSTMASVCKLEFAFQFNVPENVPVLSGAEYFVMRKVFES